jgi:hypothetical protein
MCKVRSNEKMANNKKKTKYNGHQQKKNGMWWTPFGAKWRNSTHIVDKMGNSCTGGYWLALALLNNDVLFLVFGFFYIIFYQCCNTLFFTHVFLTLLLHIRVFVALFSQLWCFDSCAWIIVCTFPNIIVTFCFSFTFSQHCP